MKELDFSLATTQDILKEQKKKEKEKWIILVVKKILLNI